uniref:Uncharacterized protein n=1 Tax=Canis lupus familiaris TaxID=9615 RepID=A0A8I3MQ49_CANLF
MLAKSSTRPVGLPWASCVWKTSLRGAAGGAGGLPNHTSSNPSTPAPPVLFTRRGRRPGAGPWGRDPRGGPGLGLPAARRAPLEGEGEGEGAGARSGHSQTL